MSSVIDGFFKGAFEPEMGGLLLGGGLGYALTRGSAAARLGGAALGATLGEGLAAGVVGLTEEVDTEGLTPGEIEVLREEAEQQERWRNITRIMALGGGAASAALIKSPVPLIAAIPAATIAPIGRETSHLKRVAKRFRAARRSS